MIDLNMPIVNDDGYFLVKLGEMNYLYDYAMQFVGVPYKWGGNHPCDGLDCSGLVQIILAAAGIDPPLDQTAQSLYDHFNAKEHSEKQNLGALAFYGKDEKNITHVAFCLNPWVMIEAGGGGKKIETAKDAITYGAMVRIRPINYRKDLVKVLMPDYSGIGGMQFLTNRKPV